MSVTFEQTANPYMAPDVSASAWEQQEGDRLQTMDDVLAAVTAADLMPVFEEVQAAKGTTGVTLLDIGAGPSTTTERLCDARGVEYFALDVNESFLASRPTDEDHKLLGKSEDLPLEDKSVDITYSRAVTAWNADPKQAIAEQLRVTRDKAVFTEFDWSHVTVNSPDMSVVADGMAARAAMLGALSRVGFKTEYGQKLGREIQEVADAAGIAIVRSEVRHELPEGDHRALFLGAASTIVEQLKQAGPGAAATVASFLEGYMHTVRNAKEVRMRLPALVTNVVEIVE
jgi:ubiquinone/menaquinone biosynthesis C-methylase UbiE